VLLQIPDVAIEPAHRIDPCWIAQETCVIAQQRSAHGSGDKSPSSRVTA